MGFNPYEKIADFCDVCGCLTDYCICPECHVCGKVGDPICYTDDEKHGHWMLLTEEQKESRYISQILKELEWDRE